NIFRHFDLPAMIATAVGVTAVDHDVRREPRPLERSRSRSDAARIVVRAGLTASQHEMTMRIACRGEDDRPTFERDGWETMRLCGHDDGVDCDLDIAARRILEADGR